MPQSEHSLNRQKHPTKLWYITLSQQQMHSTHPTLQHLHLPDLHPEKALETLGAARLPGCSCRCTEALYLYTFNGFLDLNTFQMFLIILAELRLVERPPINGYALGIKLLTVWLKDEGQTFTPALQAEVKKSVSLKEKKFSKAKNKDWQIINKQERAPST